LLTGTTDSTRVLVGLDLLSDILSDVLAALHCLPYAGPSGAVTAVMLGGVAKRFV